MLHCNFMLVDNSLLKSLGIRCLHYVLCFSLSETTFPFKIVSNKTKNTSKHQKQAWGSTSLPMWNPW